MKESNNPCYFGVIVGRVASRISDAKFNLEGNEYLLEANDGQNCLHGGYVGLGRVIWNAEEIPNGVRFEYISKDGDGGFPGVINFSATYTLTCKTPGSMLLRLCLEGKLLEKQ